MPCVQSELPLGAATGVQTPSLGVTQRPMPAHPRVTFDGPPFFASGIQPTAAILRLDKGRNRLFMGGGCPCEFVGSPAYGEGLAPPFPDCGGRTNYIREMLWQSAAHCLD